MEIASSRPQERDYVYNQSPTTSNSNSNSSIASNGSSHQIPTPPLTPNPITCTSHETNPYPTTFVQADTSSFKQVVQLLTGSPKNDHPLPSRGGGSSSIPPIKSTGQKKQGFKLYERRNSLKNGLMINTLVPGFSHNSDYSPRQTEILSPSILDFPALVLSPATPLIEDSLSKDSVAPSPSMEEEKAIAEKRFYFHPSPRNAEPQLLPLFPVTSPRVTGSSN